MNSKFNVCNQGSYWIYLIITRLMKISFIKFDSRFHFLEVYRYFYDRTSVQNTSQETKLLSNPQGFRQFDARPWISMNFWCGQVFIKVRDSVAEPCKPINKQTILEIRFFEETFFPCADAVTWLLAHQSWF